MHEGEEILHIDFVMGLKSAQGGAILQKIFFSDVRYLVFRKAHAFTHVNVHALFDGFPQAGIGWIERIVKVEEDGGESHSAIIIAPCLFDCFLLKSHRKLPRVK